MTFQPGNVVWARTGNQHEEPATVEKVGCLREDDDKKVKHDGILVKLNVSMYKMILAPADLRPMQDTGRPSRSPTPSGRRRSVITPSPNNTADSEVEEDAKKPTAKRKRASLDIATQSATKGNNAAKARKKEECTAEAVSPYFSKKSESKVAVAATVSAEKPVAKKAKKATTAKAAKAPTGDAKKSSKKNSITSSSSDKSASSSGRNSSSTSSDSESDETDQKVKTPKQAKSTKRIAKASSVAKKPAAKKKPSVQIELTDSSETSSSESDEEDGWWQRPFVAEYAPSGRATCRRCDEVIRKDELRVSHVPLFRGKPGFRIYRHLHCALFSEEIEKPEDVGGWKKLSKEDYEALTLRIEESKMELEQENEEMEPDELVQASFQGEIRKSPPGLTANLLPFQVEGASWMYHQEVHVPEIRGGILADEMGMGKTLESITTILDNKPKLQHSRPGAKHPPSSPDLESRVKEEKLWAKAVEDWKHEMEMNNVSKKMRPKKLGGARAGTLVICPVIALSQWKSEIEKFVEHNALTVGTYHGPNRVAEMPPEMLQKYDIILTTYQVLEQDFRKMVSPNKVACPNCGGKFKINKLKVHLKYFCGEGAQRTEAQARQRRSTERGGAGRNSGNQSGKGRKEKGKKPPMTKSAEKTVSKSSRRTIRVKSNGEYESDSELSIEEEIVQTSANRRPSRSSAVVASKLVSSSVKEWGAAAPGWMVKVKDDDDSSFDSDDDEESSISDESSDEDEPICNLKSKKGKRFVPKKRPAVEIHSSDGDERLERAREKQRQALANAKRQKSEKCVKSANGKKGSAKGNKGKSKKNFDDESSDESSDNEVDPLADIDMDELMNEAMAGSQFSPLHSFCWWRIVLDEAHFIKSRSSQTAAAAFALSGIHRWCLSGTPLQNRVGELYSLIRFLRIEPMAHYFCRQKGCSCKSIHYRMKDGKCQDCGHRPFSHYSHFNKYVLNPIQRDGYTGDGRRAMFKLKTEVLDKCLLRRTKETRAEDMNLPPRIVTIRPIRLHPIEEDFYNALYMQTRSSFDDYIAEGTLLNNYAHIFDLLTKMRQAVDHPYLIVYSKKNTAGRKAAPVANGTTDCEICHESPTDRVLSSCCQSGFCRECVVEYLTSAVGDNTPCPSCQSPFTIDLNQASHDNQVDDGTLTIPQTSARSDNAGVPSLKELQHVPSGSILRRINLAEFATSSKIEVLVQELIEMRKQRPGSKALVFSQFVNMLDLIRWRLHSDPYLSDLGLGVRILHGGMDVKSRDATLKDFRENNDVRVLLMSLKAGGVALNLTVASEVFLVDNWWNPAAEMQAIDRTHRLGQYRPIRAVRFIAEGTVEERVLQLQEKKRLVFDGTVGRDAGSLKMLTVDDMKALFA